jgi:hypothetical protein
VGGRWGSCPGAPRPQGAPAKDQKEKQLKKSKNKRKDIKNCEGDAPLLSFFFFF